VSGQKDQRLLPGLALAMVGAIAFSGKAIIVKLAYRYGVDAVTLIMYRMLFALPIFTAMAWWASRGKPPLSGRDWLGVAAWASAAITSPAFSISRACSTSPRRSSG
jgi:drug/metabolite transporter (DMT)-like permease